MPLRVGLGECDITPQLAPPAAVHKIGWLKVIVADTVLDPLFARVAAIECDGQRIGFVQLDTLSVRWTTVAEIRRRIEARTGFPGANIMVAATHNHAGPAVANAGDVRRDDAYVETLVERVADAFASVLANAVDAEIGFGHGFEFELNRNRRVVMRDGTVKTQAAFKGPDELYVEGPIDPEVAVLAARATDGRLLGAIVNFACHPTHHGGTGELSAGYPGVLDRELKRRGCPVTLFLNGACGNIIDAPRAGDSGRRTKEQIGEALAADVESILARMAYRPAARLSALRQTIQLPYRRYTQAEARGAIRGAQRFIDSAIYDRGIARLIQRIDERKTQPAEVQSLGIDEVFFVSIPAEYFVQLGLKIKERCHPRHALVVSHANGMVGYVPHREAFERGGYETTFGETSRLAPEAGDLLADCAIELVKQTAAPAADGAAGSAQAGA